jgi:phosphatidate cytidylyltransferase
VLRERIVTAVVLAALLLGSLLSDKPVLYSLLLGAFVSVAAWEWAGLIHCRQTRQRILYAVLLILPLPFLYFSISTFWVAFVVLVGVVGWLVAAIMVLGYQVDGQFVPAGRPAGILTGLLVLVPAWTGLVWLYPQRQGPQLILLFFATIWLVDSAAFCAGRRWGKNRLASRVSPGKTWEGFYAGIVAAFLPSLGFVVFNGFTMSAGIGLVVLCVICAVFSVIGDLFISMFKRQANVKDTSHLLPGHGGVLDRIDSITAAAPVFATGIWMLEGRF